VNGESIHGTKASPFDALAFGRCTVKAGKAGLEGTKLFLHVFDWPKDQRLVLPGLGNEIGRAYLLAQPSKGLVCKRQDSDVWISVPETAPDPIDTVVALEIRGAPVVYKAPKIEAASDIFVKPLEVKLVASAKDLEIRYTTDGSEPTAASTLYHEPVVVETTTTIRARSFHDGHAVSGSSSAQFERATPFPGMSSRGKHPAEDGIHCDRFEGDWDRLPDFDKLQGGKAGVVDHIGLEEASSSAINRRAERCALRFVGVLEVESSDVYRFELTSDDGSKLRIHDEVVVDNDGLHSRESKTGRIALGEGLHYLVVEWFNKSGGAELSLRIAPSDGAWAEIHLRPTLREGVIQ
jgi:alpha-L-fucosidase